MRLKASMVSLSGFVNVIAFPQFPRLHFGKYLLIANRFAQKLGMCATFCSVIDFFVPRSLNINRRLPNFFTPSFSPFPTVTCSPSIAFRLLNIPTSELQMWFEAPVSPIHVCFSFTIFLFFCFICFILLFLNLNCN